VLCLCGRQMKLWSLELRCVMFSNKITPRAICFSSRGRILAPFANHYSSPLSAQNEKKQPSLTSHDTEIKFYLLTYSQILCLSLLKASYTVCVYE